jgi:outer membrane protein OmpA-like peptidoglycan-associated protein
MVMKKYWKIAGFFVVFFLGHLSVEAQNKSLRFAEDKFKYESYGFAIDELEKSYSKKEKYTTAQLIAESYQEIQNYDKSFEWWNKVIQFEESTKEDFYQYLISGMKSGEGYVVEEILEGKNYTKNDFPEIDFEFMKQLYSRRSNIKLIPFDSVNSTGSDYGIVKGMRGQKFFASDRGEVIPSEKKAIRLDAKNQFQGKEKYNFNDRQFFSVYRKDSAGQVSQLSRLSEKVFHFSDPYFVKEKNVLFYSVTKELNKVKKERVITVFPELYYSTLGENGELLDSYAFPFNDSLHHGVISPFVDFTGKKLYFASNMQGGYGGYDLYYSAFDDDFNFETPVNLGPQVNTPGNERDPFLFSNKFYFSSDGHKGLGGFDIFSSDYSVDVIKNVQNMGIPFNSPTDDFSYRQFDSNQIFISSDRKGGQGMDDIYSIEELFKHLMIVVSDCEGEVITQSFLTNILDKTKGGNVQSRRGTNGNVYAELEPNSDFDITISKPGYFSLTDHSVTTKGMEEDTVKRNYQLIPIPYQLPVYVDIVYYDLDKFVIRPDAVPPLEKLADLMKRYSFLDLLVASHTDSRASDEYNIVLSNNRAKAVMDFLEKRDISPSRVRLEWFGEQALTNECGDGVNCADLEHQLNRRSEMILEAFPDPTKQYGIPEELKDINFCEPELLHDWLQDQINEIPTVYFDFDKSMLRSVHKKELERTAVMLKKLPKLNLSIEGHTDQRGDGTYNQQLSERRAEVVKTYLVERGIDSNRLESSWFGFTKPVHDCNSVTCTPAMHQLNRRTELRIGYSKFGYTGRQKKMDSL